MAQMHIISNNGPGALGRALPDMVDEVLVVGLRVGCGGRATRRRRPAALRHNDCRCLLPSMLRNTLSSRIVGRNRLLWNSMVQGTQRFR